jgi:ketosteroid isomerase-like protein
VFPDGEIVYGHEGIRQGWRRWRGAWQKDFEIHAEEFRELDPSTIFVVVRDSGTAKSTGIKLDRRIFQIWEMRGGLVVRTRHFLDPSEALEAVGLQE